MSVIATIEVAADEFVLGEALSTNPGIEVRLERVVPLGSTFVPYVWAGNDSVEGVESALRAAADVESFAVLDAANGEALVRVTWREDVDGLLEVVARSEATVLEAVGEAGRWRFQLRFATHDDLTEFYRRCVDRGVSLDLRSVHEPGAASEAGVELGLTDTQRETLLLALAAGYFDVPRRTNLTELAAELGVSDTATSQRIRRGVASLLEATIAESTDGDAEGGPGTR